MEKQAIQKLLETKSTRLGFETYEGKSQVWKSFVLVTVDGLKVPFVKCSNCNTLLKWRSKDGTSSLSGHQEHCSNKGSSQTRKITDMPGYKNASTSAVPSTVKSQMANDLVHMCATDIRPFSIVDGGGFKKVAQKLISIGAQYGNVSVGDVLPCSSTVSRHLESMVACRKSELRDKLAEAVNVAVTTDGWTHALTNVQYITTTVHYIDKDWSMHAHILATRPAVDKHTADYIRNFVVDILLEFGLQKEGNIFVTDNAANMKAAFREMTWIGCAGHNLNLVLSHALQPSTGDDPEYALPEEVATLITTCKELVTLSKRSNINNKLDSTLKQCVSTRWNSILTMLTSVDKSKAQLRAVTADPQVPKKLLRLLGDLHDDILADVIAVLTPFDTATKVLSAEKSPTIQLVLPTLCQLRHHLTSVDSDDTAVAGLKQRLSRQLEKYFVIAPVHVAATLLDPRLKDKHSLMSDALKDQGIEALRQMVESRSRTTDRPTNEQSDSEQPPRKRAHLDEGTSSDISHDFFQDLFKAPAPSCVTTDQLQTYLSTTGEVVADGDVLQYWKHKEVTLSCSYISPRRSSDQDIT